MSATKKSVPPEPIGGDKAELGQRALKDKKLLRQLVAALSGEDRAQRSLAAEVLHDVACSEPRLLQPYGAEFVDALLRPEARTRWETLDVLTEMVAVDTRLVEKALPDAIECMHDEESSVVRTSACRMLAAWGATTETRAAKIWPLLAEASRAYHGDPEYGPMLAGVVTLVEGAAGDEVKWAAAELFESDVTDPDRGVARRAKRIAQLKPKRKPAKGAKPKAAAAAKPAPKVAPAKAVAKPAAAAKPTAKPAAKKAETAAAKKPPAAKAASAAKPAPAPKPAPAKPAAKKPPAKK